MAKLIVAILILAVLVGYSIVKMVETQREKRRINALCETFAKIPRVEEKHFIFDSKKSS